MKTILVTGGAGFIGSHFVRHALKKHADWRVVNFDKLTYSGNLENLRDISRDPKLRRRYTFVKGDIANEKTVVKVFKKYKPEFLVNFAAESHVDRSIHEGVDPFIHTNVFGVKVLLEAIRAFGIQRAVFVSTDEVYGSLGLRSKQKFTEQSQYHPNNPYSATKAAGDLLVSAYRNTWNVLVMVTHGANTYGPYHYPEKIIPFFILRAMAGKPLPLYGDGKYVRDWLHVFDHVSAIDRVLVKGQPGEAYNIGANEEYANIDVARMILRELRKPSRLITFVKDRPGHDRRYATDFSKIRRELGWKPRYTFKKMLPETIQWYQNHPEWVRNVRERVKTFNPHIT